LSKKMLMATGLDVWSMGAGKGAQSLYQTLTGYANGGWEVYFITGNKSKDSVYDLHPGIKIIRFDQIWLKKLYGWRVLSHLAKNLWWLIFQLVVLYYGFRLARRERFNLFYGYDTLGVPCTYLLAKIFKKPFISRFQGTTIGYFRHKRFWRLKYWDQILALKLPSDLLIMTNDGQEEDKLLASLGVNMSRVKFWRNGINKDFSLPPGFNAEEFKKEKLGLKAGNKIILTASRLHKWKRIDRVITAMPEVLKRDSEARLVVIGEGEEYQRLVALSESLKLKDKVFFAGSVPQRDIAMYLAIADVFVSCNDSANVGNPLLEAMVAGRCIVTLNNGATGELIKNNITGKLLEMDQISSMGEVIAGLLENKNERILLGNNARALAQASFWTWQERIGAELELAEKLLEKHQARILFISSVHRWDDPRIFHKEAQELKKFYRVEIHAQAPFSYKEVNGIEVYGLPIYRRRIFRCLNWLRLTVRALRAKADVVHFHDPELIPVGIFLKIVTNKNVIYDIHEHNEETLLSREWIPGPLRRPCAWLVNKIELVSAGVFSGLIVADDQLAIKFNKARAVEVIRNFPPSSFGEGYLTQQEREAEKPLNYEPVVIYVGVLGVERGLETVLEAMPMVRSEFPGAKCLLVGRVHYKGLAASYRDNLDEYLARGNITVTGQVSYDQVMSYLAQSDVGWTPFPPITKHRWGIGTKLTEYMAMSLPVVASDYGEGAEVVKKENCGLLVPPLDPAAHAGAISQLLADRYLARTLGRNGREAFLKRYTWESQAVKLIRFYERLLGVKGGDIPA
jgi:glycosyltransferase involved in cell wall biosynthesis